jgi:hypothetical protein
MPPQCLEGLISRLNDAVEVQFAYVLREGSSERYR